MEQALDARLPGDVEKVPDKVLIAEIPSGGVRWNQAHFNKDVIADFFEVQPETTQRVYLTPVEPSGARGPQEMRPCVYSRSSNKNLKIELGLGRGLGYPSDDYRPLGVFRRVQARVFEYMLLMPGDEGYDATRNLMLFLDSIGKGRHRSLTNTRQLADVWPACPLLLVEPKSV